ncbi:MAG: hypothetical protein M1820_007304 [Bogoriella megaspora]|nr:MAG: hypothetical protein M1820_007304 [Bogoriella megaspora]
MPFQIAPIENDDFLGVAQILHRGTHDSEPGFALIFPRMETPEGLAKTASILSTGYGKNDDIHWIKAVDEESGRMASSACWITYPHDPYNTSGTFTGERHGDDESNPLRQFFEFFYKDKWLQRSRFEEVRRPHCFLLVLWTDPDFQRKGAATALLDWGLNKADELGLACFLEASPRAHKDGFYHKRGFCDIAAGTWIDERDPDHFRYKIIWMLRPAKGEEPPKRREDQVHRLS